MVKALLELGFILGDGTQQSTCIGPQLSRALLCCAESTRPRRESILCVANHRSELPTRKGKRGEAYEHASERILEKNFRRLNSPPQNPSELLRHRLAMLRPFLSDEGGPITRGSKSFAIRRAELELHSESAFAERWVCCEREAFLKLHLGFGGVVDVAELDRAATRPGDAEGR